MNAVAEVKLKKNEERRIRAGHLWVFSNEIDVSATPLTAYESGQLVKLVAHNGQVLGIGYINPANLISVRLLTRQPELKNIESLLRQRIQSALALRQQLYDQPYYRLVFGEADFLPGLVVDRYGDQLVMQTATAGMERLKQPIVDALVHCVKPAGLCIKNDAGSREAEQLPLYIETPLGAPVEELQLQESGVPFVVPLAQGQKTGWFYDQRPHRDQLAQWCHGKSILDVFSYLGGWGVRAAMAGASDVTCVDASATAVDYIHKNARLNQVDGVIKAIQADAFDALKAMREQRDKFEIVIIDPPAFIKRKKDSRKGLEAYHRLNQMAIQVLAPNGLLVSSSCSMHLPREELQKVILQSARHLDRQAQILLQGYQGPDHPMHPAIPETAYLKTIFARISPV